MNDQEQNDMRFDLTEKHTEILEQQYSALRNHYMYLGNMLVDLLDASQSAISLRKSIQATQEDICKELRIPHADRLIWNIDKKYVEVPEQERKKE